MDAGAGRGAPTAAQTRSSSPPQPGAAAGATAGSPLGAPRARATDRTLLRYGVRPFLLLADVTAWALVVVPGRPPVGSELVLLALTVALYGAAGLYRSRLSLSALDDLPALGGRALAAAALTTSLALLLKPGPVDGTLLLTAAALAVLVVLLRAAAYAVVKRVRARGWVAHPTLILGAGRVGGQLARLLLDHPSYGLRPVGFLDSDPLLSAQERPVALLGGTEALASIIVEFGIQDVIVAFGSARESQMVDVIRTCDRLEAEIFFVPRLFEVHQTSRDMDQVWGLPLVRLRRATFRTRRWRVKRLIDIALSGTALLLLAPLMALIALAVRCDSGPGCLFRQERIGLDGRPFWMLKFRSLKPVDDVDAHQTWSVSGDARISRLGRLLRATSLDELPQLWNILRGDMSVVGPRPERTYFVQQLNASVPRYVDKHRVPAGLTGWAQIHGLRGGATSLEDRARFDNYYIENWSLWTDVKIMLRTVLAVLRRTGS